jgi:hypothetical protein
VLAEFIGGESDGGIVFNYCLILNFLSVKPIAKKRTFATTPLIGLKNKLLPFINVTYPPIITKTVGTASSIACIKTQDHVDFVNRYISTNIIVQHSIFVMLEKSMVTRDIVVK